MEPFVEPRLVQTLEVLFKRKLAIASFVVGSAVAALWFAQPSYKTEAQLLLQVGREHVVDASLPTAGAVRPSVRFEQNEQTTLASEILQGHTLLRSVVDRLGRDTIYPGLAPSGRASADELAVRQLGEALEVKTSGLSTLVKVSFEHDDPRVAAEVTNALAEGFVERHIGILKDQNRYDFLEEQIAQRSQELADHERNFSEFKIANGLTSGSLEEERMRLHEHLRTLQLDESNAGVDAAVSRSRLNYLERLARDSANINSGRFNSMTKEARAELERERSSVRAFHERKHSLGHATETLTTRLEELDVIASDFKHLAERVTLSRQQYNLHVTKLAEAQFSEAMDSYGLSSVRVIEPAPIPTVPISSRRAALALALFIGLCAGVLWAYILEFLLGTVDTPTDAERYLGTTPIASIPEFESS